MTVINGELRDALGGWKGKEHKQRYRRAGERLEIHGIHEIQPHSPWTSWDGAGAQEDTIFVFLQLVSH